MKKYIIFILTMFAVFSASAKLTDAKAKSVEKQKRTHSVLLSNTGQAICVTSYNDTNVSSLNLPHCNSAQASLTDAVNPNGVDVAFFSYIGAGVIGCGVGILANTLADELDSDLYSMEDALTTGVAVGGSYIIGRLLFSSGHGSAAGLGSLICTFGSQAVHSYFIN